MLYRCELVLGEGEELKIDIGAEGGRKNLADAVTGEDDMFNTDELF